MTAASTAADDRARPFVPYAAMLTAALLLGGCWMPFRSASKHPPPPQPTPLPIQTAPPLRIEPPPEIIEPQVPKAPPPEFPRVEPQPPEPEPAPRTRTPAVTAPPAQPAPSEPPREVTPRVPELGPMLTGPERAEYYRAVDELAARCRQNIGRARQRGLDARRRELVAQAQGFLDEALQLREKDPVGAKNLAERAEVMSREAADR